MRLYSQKSKGVKVLSPFVFCFLIFFPPFSFSVLKLSSNAVGLVVFSIFFSIIIFFSKTRISHFFSKKIVYYYFFSFSIILLHTLITVNANNQFNQLKFISSFIFIFLLSIVAKIFGKFFLMQTDVKIEKLVRIVIFVFFLNSLLPLFKINFLDSIKGVGFFSEPSHFALIISPFLFFYSFVNGRASKLLLVYFFLWGIYILNMTIVLVIFFCFFALLLKKNRLFIFVFPIIFFVKSIVTLEYFSHRLNISSTSDNLSVLIFLNGWEKAKESLALTYNWGIGFQQLGYYKLEEKNEVAQKLVFFNLENLNKYDGGSLAPKVISEFGFLGILVILLFLYLFIRLIFNLSKKQLNYRSKSELFLLSCILCFIFELFIRSIGYFSIGFFLFISSITNLQLKPKSYNLRKRVLKKKTNYN